jgi:hypothetical protein
MTPIPTPQQRIGAAAWAALHSLYISFAAVSGGLLTAAAVSGNATSWPVLLAYTKANAFGYVIANLIAPSIRAAAAAKKGPTP